MDRDYYGRIGGDNGSYMWLVIIGDGPEGYGAYYTNPNVKWKIDKTGDSFEAAIDATHYDTLTESEALKIAREWGND